ncbi:alpha/beta fold hydrolase [Belliella marina]|uniref:Alpha/beta fold hydrolase n=1 Tax=Belliella marina TaxID=1644146 RepID=A0ABW4VL55_9BACT
MKNFNLVAIVVMASLLFAGCQKESFTLSGMAEDHFFLKSGNQLMPITVAGNVDSKKFIVLIHGGPGGNALVYRNKAAKNIVENEFAMVYWDQRFAGNTQGNGGNTHISEFRSDIKKLLTLLRTKYDSDIELYLFAHSWGGFLAPYFLADGDNQEMVKGWIQIGGAHNYRLNDSLTHNLLLHYGNIELAAGRNVSKWSEIVEWCTQNSFEGIENARKLNSFAHSAESLIEEVIEPESDFNFEQIQRYAFMSNETNSIASKIRRINHATYANPNSDQLFKIQIPTLLMWGKYDFVCSPGLANDIELNIGTSDVHKIIYPYSGHNPMLNQPEEFWYDLVDWVKSH